MRFDLEMDEGANQIRGYAKGQVKVNDTIYEKSVMVMADKIVEDWPPQQIADLVSEHLKEIISLNPEVVLLGTGEQLFFPDSDILQPLRDHNIGFEVMNTAAACRTYSVLVSEGRKVLAALLLN